jgi:hypothetical protein
VEFPQSAEKIQQTITQAELCEFIEFQNLRVQLEERIKTLSLGLRTRIESGATVESGVHVATLKESSRRNVGWKDVVIRLAGRLGLDGETYCSNVLAHTKPTRTLTVEVH